MKTRLLVAAVGIPLLLCVLLLLPGVGTAALVALITAVAAYELLSAVDGAKHKNLKYAAAAYALCASVCAWLFGEVSFLPAAVFAVILTAAYAIYIYEREEPLSFGTMAAAVFGAAIIPYMLSCLTMLRMMDDGRLLVLLPLVVAFMSDSGAYFAGKFMGKRKAFPKVSPHKTVEGCIGSIASGLAGVCIYGLVLQLMGNSVNWLGIVLCGVFGNIACQLGDLAFSCIKRLCGIKDYGKLLPGHGGSLDRFDSMSFVAPVIYFVVLWVGIV